MGNDKLTYKTAFVAVELLGYKCGISQHSLHTTCNTFYVPELETSNVFVHNVALYVKEKKVHF